MMARRSLTEINTHIHKQLDNDLLDFLVALSALDLESATGCWHRFAAGIRAHADAEDGLVLRRFEAVAPATAIDKMSLIARDHRIIEGTLSEVDALMEHLLACESGSRRRVMVENFGSLMRLRSALEHHGQREAETLYPTLDRKLAEAEIDELTAVLIAPSPSAPPDFARRQQHHVAPSQGVVEPFRIVRCEPVPELTWHERRLLLERAGFCTAHVAADHATIDLGEPTPARGPRPTRGARGWVDHGPAVRTLTGCPIIIETPATHSPHDLLLELFCRPGDLVLGNGLASSMRVALAARGAEGCDLFAHANTDVTTPQAFRGDIDLAKLQALLSDDSPRIPLVVLAVVSPFGGGQPISCENVRQAAEICRTHGARLFIDLTHSVAGAALAWQQDPGQGLHGVADYVHAMCAHADGCVWGRGPFSGPTFLAVFDDGILPTDATDVLREQSAGHGEPMGQVTDPEELLRAPLATYGVRSVSRAASRLRAMGVPVLWPPGAHSVVIDAATFAPHVCAERFPGVSLSVELYQRGGVRVPLVGVAGAQPSVELPLGVRFLTRMQIDYVVDVVVAIHQQVERLQGFDRTCSETPLYRPCEDVAVAK